MKKDSFLLFYHFCYNKNYENNQNRKEKRLYILELDNTENLYITEDTIVHFMLSKGMIINAEKLENIKKFAQLSYGKNLGLYYISFKQRTEKEVIKYLQQHDIDSKIIPQIIDNLKSENWINDKNYVQSFIQQNLNNGDKGPYVIKQKLLQKGIKSKIIESELKAINFQDLASKISQKLYKKYQNKLPLKALKDKLMQSLTTKGFDYQIAHTVIQNLEIEKDQELEDDLIYKELDKQYQKLSKKHDQYELKQRIINALMRKGYQYEDIKSALREYL